MPSNQILVIEDHPLFATGIKDLVEFVATNADILCAANMAHAAELCSKNSPALFITDLRLPDAEGQVVINTLTQLNPNLPMLIKLAKTRDLPVAEAVAAALDAGRKYINSLDLGGGA